MGKITVTKCISAATNQIIEGLYIVEPEVFGDHRGYFMETYHQQQFFDAGLTMKFVQDNQSASGKGVLRGMHFQVDHPQGKLIRVLQGVIYDAVVDLRRDSKTFGLWFGAELSKENHKQLYIPEGFAHGFYVCSEWAEITYKCTDFYHPGDEGGLPYNDSTLKIQWPILEGTMPVLSDRDKIWPAFSEQLRYFTNH